VGPLEDQRWLNCALLSADQPQVQRDHVWADWTALPKLTEFPDREAAVVTEGVIRTGGEPYTTIFPIDTQAEVCKVLELQSELTLSFQTQALIDSVLWIYQNLQGLLDYGERDSLTNLLNRKSFDGAFLRAASHAATQDDQQVVDRRVEHPDASYWLAVIDIDHFKRVNDNFGHLIGDEVLLLMAGLMRLNFRLHDQIYRFGGEEFVILMRCADHTDAQRALSRFRHKVEEHDFPQVGHITVSIGFAALRSNDTPGGAFDRADKAVYYAKAHGRNQVCSYAELVQSGELTEPSVDLGEADFF
jgi:diguanylate cyclase (GGDEF)-like protein